MLGNAWIKFLESFDEKNLIPASEFIVNLMSKEISSYKKYIYEVNSAKEPFSFDYLPNYSVVRGIGEFVRTKVTKLVYFLVRLLKLSSFLEYKMEIYVN